MYKHVYVFKVSICYSVQLTGNVLLKLSLHIAIYDAIFVQTIESLWI